MLFLAGGFPTFAKTESGWLTPPAGLNSFLHFQPLAQTIFFVFHILCVFSSLLLKNWCTLKHDFSLLILFFSSHQQSVLLCNTDCWCDEKKVLAMNTQQEPTLKQWLFITGQRKEEILQISNPIPHRLSCQHLLVTSDYIFLPHCWWQLPRLLASMLVQSGCCLMIMVQAWHSE